MVLTREHGKWARLRGGDSSWGGLRALPLLAAITLSVLSAACSGEQERGGKVRADSNCSAAPPPFIEDGFPQPEFRHSEDGSLETTLRAASETVTLDGKPYITQAYEKSVPGPLLIVCPGDRMVVNLENDLEENTNLHTHGFHVSPRDNSDNIFLDINPGERFTYEYDIPEDESPGAYWYHPHRHGDSDGQVFAGMAGPMIVEGGLDAMPGIRDIPQRVLAIQNTELGDNGRTVPVARSDDSKTQLFVNGAINPRIDIRPGELQRWRIYNMNADNFVKLRLEGQKFQLLATDGNTLERMQPVDQMLIGPGSRREVLVRGGTPGSYKLEVLPFDSFPGADTSESTLATLVSGDEPAEEEQDAIGPLEEQEDLRDVPVDRERKIVYSEDGSADPPKFLINGKEFDHDRVDQTMKLGDVEEWSITSKSDEWHTFHIHVNDFQLVEMDGKPVEGISPQDNVSIAPNSSVKMRTRFTDFTGKFVFHCHVLFHEDHGMMSVIEVVDPEGQDEASSESTGSHHDEGH
ncbi:MAG: multicopper oxidase family protein [Rubrobacter sp.]|nr:multicopper oxidase family protein [Rubrobacter sp.]